MQKSVKKLLIYVYILLRFLIHLYIFRFFTKVYIIKMHIINHGHNVRFEF